MTAPRPRIAVIATGPIHAALEAAWPELSPRLERDYPDHDVTLAQRQPDDEGTHEALAVAPIKGVLCEGSMTPLPKVDREVLADVGRELEVWWAGRQNNRL